MNSDMREAMKEEEFPLIRYSLITASLLSGDVETSTAIIFNTVGTLSIAGRSKRVEIPVNAERLPDGKFRIAGSSQLSMFEFGITPPTAFFGLIRAHDRLVVHFDLLVAQDEVGHETIPKDVSAK